MEGTHARVLDSREDLECIICMELLCEPLVLPCTHVFCRGCLVSAMQAGRNCPICRAAIPGHFNPAVAPVEKSVENVLIRCCTMEYEERLEDVALAAARLIRLRIGNSCELQGMTGNRLNVRWTVQVDLERQPDEAAALPSDAELPHIVEKVRFGLRPACRVLSSGSKPCSESIQKSPAPSHIEVTEAPFEVTATSWTAFTVPVVIFFKEWLSRPPLRLEHMLDFHKGGGSWSYGVDLADAFTREIQVLRHQATRHCLAEVAIADRTLVSDAGHHENELLSGQASEHRNVSLRSSTRRRLLGRMMHSGGRLLSGMRATTRS